MRVRIISGLVAAVILVALLLLPSYVICFTIMAASLIGIYEYANAVKAKGIQVDRGVSYLAAITLSVSAFVNTLPVKEGSAFTEAVKSVLSRDIIPAAIFLIIVFLFSRILFENGKYKMDDVAYTLFGLIYIPFLLSYAIMVRNFPRGFEYIWMVLIGAMVTDVFAYFVGVFFGKKKIIPEISAKKTVEGSIGGALGCMVIMILYGVIFINRPGFEPVPVYHFAILGFLCGVVSQIGDWSASAVKRSTGIKDFGSLIPGHGGIMDRCDSILFVAPLVYYYITLLF